MGAVLGAVVLIAVVVIIIICCVLKKKGQVGCGGKMFGGQTSKFKIRGFSNFLDGSYRRILI